MDYIPSFFFDDTPTTAIYTLSLHDALPIFQMRREMVDAMRAAEADESVSVVLIDGAGPSFCSGYDITRSEEHTSELQSHVNLVCRLLLEKKNNDRKTT